MCNIGVHTCYCKKDYICIDPNWLCPTVNEDEDGWMCPECMEKLAKDYQEWVDNGEGV